MKDEKTAAPFWATEHAQHEDAALKTMMQFFAEELLPYFGISEKVSAVAPTELVQLDISRLYQDFNFVMEDGSWKHFEFQSKNEGKAGLRRFRTYESVTSYQHEVSVTTYVLYSGNIKNPMTELTEGINTYRVVPIIMKNQNADLVLKKLKKKVRGGKSLEREELAQLPLCPLMGGRLTQKERILAAFALTRSAQGKHTKEEIRKIEAVIYAMADKFLEAADMEEVKEAVRMTRLGQMLVAEGIEKGIEQGTEETKLNSAKNLLDILSEEVIAERIGLPLEKVKELKKQQNL